MSKLKIGTGDWVVVCDGRKALILANQGDEKFPNLRRREVHPGEPHGIGAAGFGSAGTGERVNRHEWISIIRALCPCRFQK